MTERVLVGGRPPLQIAPSSGEALRVKVAQQAPVVVVAPDSSPLPVMEPERPRIQVLQALMGPAGEIGIKSVETLPPGALAQVVNEGSPTHADLVFRLPAGAPGGHVIRKSAQTLNAFKVVATDFSGDLIYSDAGDLSFLGRTLGVSLVSSHAAGSDVVVITEGPIINSGWSWLSGQTLFVGLGGDITGNQVGLFSQSIGYAVNETEIFVRLGRPLVRA